MATEASLSGIGKFGIKWRAVVKINLIGDIPAAFAETETMTDMIALAHNICQDLIKSLRKINWDREWDAPDPIATLDELGLERKYDYLDNVKGWMDNFLQELEETFVIEDLDQLQNYDQDDLLNTCDGLEEELIYRLNELYDWGDYWRICFRGKRSVIKE